MIKTINVTHKKKFDFVLDGVENMLEKGEITGYQHFLLFPQCFQKLSLADSLKMGIVSYRVKGGIDTSKNQCRCKDTFKFRP